MGWFLRTSRWVRVLLLVALPMGSLAYGQTASAISAANPQTAVDVLHQMSDKADVIFAGQVLAVRRPNSGVVEVEFRVDRAIRGCSAGSTYLLREWVGLWAGNDHRYRVGQRLLMLLHAPSAAGMNSPVGGFDGAIPIRQGGTATPLSAIASPPQPPFVDLRWLGARLPRAVSYRSGAVQGAKADGLPTPLFAQRQTISVAASGLVTSAGPIMPMSGTLSPSGASVPAQQASVDAVIGMLTSWQKAQHVAP